MCTEAFGELDFACQIADDTRPNIVVLNDNLAFIAFKTPYQYRQEATPVYEQFIDIWVMMEYGVKES